MRVSVVLFAALALCAPSLVHADGTTVGKHVAALTVPIDTVVTDPNTSEDVHITGSLLVKTNVHYIPGNPVKVQTAFKLGKDVTGTGMTSGDPYKIKGSGALKYNWLTGDHITAVDHTGIITEIPGNPVIPGNPIRVHVHVDYNAATGDASGALVDFPNTPTFNTCSAIAQVCN
jgi:hypothetical protein